MNNSYTNNIGSNFVSVNETKNVIPSIINEITTIDTSIFKDKIEIISKEASDYIKNNKEAYEFLEDSYKEICKKNTYWRATFEKLDDYEAVNTQYKFKVFIGEPLVTNMVNIHNHSDLDFNVNLKATFSFSKTSVYNKILDKLLEKTKNTYKSIVIDENYL